MGVKGRNTGIDPSINAYNPIVSWLLQRKGSTDRIENLIEELLPVYVRYNI